MWFGTRDGVSRYDSQQIKNYYLKAFDAGVEATRVNCLYAVGHDLWVGTAVGLFRYVVKEDAFVPVALGKSSVNVSVIQQVSTGDLWVGSQDGIYILTKQGSVRHILPTQHVHAICEFRKGSFLIAQNNTLAVINAEGETVVLPVIEGISPEKAHVFRHYTLLKDRRGNIWLSTETDLLQLDEKAMVFRPIEWFLRLVKDRFRVMRTVTEDQAGNVWMGGESGVVMVDSQRRTTHWYDKSFMTSPYGLSDRAVYSSYVSKDGIVWLGTYFGGINYTKPVGISFEHLFPGTNGQTIAGKAISQIVVDGNDRLWVGTEDGGISVQDRATGRYTYHNRTNGLSDNNVHVIWIDKSGVTWVGTFMGGLNRIEPPSGRAGAPEKRVFLHNPADPGSISNNFVNAICRDRAGQLWIGTMGVNIFDEKTENFRLFRPDILGNIFIIDLLCDSSGRVWIATSHLGIYQYDPETDRLTHYHVGNTPALRSNQIISIYEDSAKNIWFGSLNGGVYQWNYAQKKFVQHPINANLPNQTVYDVLEDNRGTYWFSTNRGLLSFNPRQKTYRVFDGSNGLQATQFNFKAALKDQRGYLYFGSVDGLCYFDPEVIAKRVFDPPVYFTNLQLFNHPVSADGKSVLTKHIDETETLAIPFNQNVITLDFVAINYFSKRTNYYTYYLEGFEKTWGPKTTVNSQTYTNLSPGNYAFHVRSFKSNGELSPTERTIQLRIDPPFWRTMYAYLIYLLLGIGALLLYRRFITFLHNQKVAMQLERIERKQSEELNQQKLNFFTFLSNEFKTPITLIMAEIDQLIQLGQGWRPDSATNYSVIKKNAKRLEVLIDQITELRKTGSELQKIQATDADIVTFIKETVHGFDPLMQARHIHKRLTFSHPYLMASFDAGKLEMIVGNVFFYIINELADGDELALHVGIENLSEHTDCQLVITFSSENKQELFSTVENSYQIAVDNEDLFQQNNSPGIGILLTFSLLNVLSGTVIFGKEGLRQSLSLKLPIRRSPVSRLINGSKKQDQIHTQISSLSDGGRSEHGFAGELTEGISLADRPTMLLIDRSKDLIQFLKRHYGETYRICVADTFTETLKKAENLLPDIILCDSDIRDKENRSLCASLKNTPLTQAIPVILLLSNNDDKTVIDGLKSGADGYIRKPFNLNELDLLVDNHLKSVLLLKNKLAGGLADSLLTTLPRRNKEQEFVMRFSALVNLHYKDKSLTADMLAQRMNCSRSQLHTKLKTITGLSTKEYLNNYRLTLACQLLGNGMSVAEASYTVGFGDPNYFGRAFKKKYGKTPSRVA